MAAKKKRRSAKKKTTKSKKKGHIPLSILKNRHAKLGRIIKARS